MCKELRDVDRAFAHYGTMTAAGVAPDAEVITSLVSACGAAVEEHTRQIRAAQRVPGVAVQARAALSRTAF